MKRLSMILMCLLAMMAASQSANAQEVTITLLPGWNWISYPNAEAMGIDEAMGDFIPMEGDMLKSQTNLTSYHNGSWSGGLTQFTSGCGYMYYSNRTETVSFVFAGTTSQMTVTTSEPTNITTTSAMVGGTVTLEMGNHIFARGICWGTEPMPTLNDSNLPDEAIAGTFSVTLIGLISNTTYYVRAYGVSEQGLVYGEEVSLTTLQSNAPSGAIDGQFSVSDLQKVYFSQGNLQYLGSASTPYWKFADNQWDYLGNNGQGSTNQHVDRDLFGWGTSGYNHGAICYQPWSTSENNVDYNPYGNSYANLYDQTGKADWGYNAISNGGNQENQWRTLSYSEWNYLLDTRNTTSGIRFAMAQVNNVNGVILLPNNWNEDIYHLNNTNLHGANFNSNIITASAWNSMEASGAVFLPVTGTRNGTSVGDLNRSYYWTSVSSGASGASALLIEDGFVATGFTFRSSGYAVRLVRNIPASLPEVSTLEPSYISSSTANVGGTVTDNGGAEITECGICWSTDENPTIEGDHLNAEGVTLGEFTIELTGLNWNTTYYYRSYATNNVGTGYGEIMSFTTVNAPVGATIGKFTVSSSGTKVHFAKGNLQYIGSATTPYWKFADHQWDYLGTSTEQDSDSENVDRDLFGWGTSGYDHGAICYQPWGTNSADSAYYAYGSYTYNLYDQTGQADWGYNAISNGGNQENQWRTLNADEWKYLLQTRNTESGVRFAKAVVNEVNGVILLPDDWDSSTFTLNSPNGGNFNSNIISASDWTSVLEPTGAVFLPAGGRRNGVSIGGEGNYGYYWSSSNSSSSYYNNPNLATFLQISAQSDLSHTNLGGTNRRMGMSVRLVYMSLPEVDTLCPVYLGNKSAIFRGGVSDYGGNEILSCGVCYSTVQNPTIDDMVTLAQNASNGSFRATLFNLTPNTTYYIRAFATNRIGMVYGEETSFTTFNETPQIVNGILPGVFSVSAFQIVKFSQGNLQYIGSSSSPYWKFAENQWDYLGNNGQGSTNQNVDRDLFGWGTSGWNHGAIAYQPWKTSTNNSHYLAYGQSSYSLYDQTGQADWGYNAISNGGNTINSWRTLTSMEWRYVFDTRATANGIRFAKAQVNGVSGVILLPDDWSEDTYNLSNPNQKDANYNSNVISSSEWSILETAGAVFLPAAGSRHGTSVSWSEYGYYWSASSSEYSDSASFIEFSNSALYDHISTDRYMGFSVRLVQSIEN